jgi:hypothetical protein
MSDRFDARGEPAEVAPDRDAATAPQATAPPSGHNPGTAPAEAPVPHGRQRRPHDSVSVIPASWPLLLSARQAAVYLNVSTDALLGYVADGTLPRLRPPRPQTHRMRTMRGQKGNLAPQHADTLRKVLFHRADLDALAERWRRDRAEDWPAAKTHD